ncbi:MAG: zinc ribbon domain-containing protein [Planctomycetota bacterium]
MAATQLTDCTHCGHSFEADARLRGGLASCPRCGKATAVAGLRDPLWLLLRIGAVVLAALSGWGAAREFGAGFGWLVGAGVLALAWVLSRAM